MWSPYTKGQQVHVVGRSHRGQSLLYTIVLSLPRYRILNDEKKVPRRRASQDRLRDDIAVIARRVDITTSWVVCVHDTSRDRTAAT